MNREQAGAIAQDARLMMTIGEIDALDYVVLDCLLWRVRDRGRWDCSATYRFIAHLTRISRNRVIGAVKHLIEAGLIAKEKRWVLVLWGGVKQARQLANRYIFNSPDKESTRCPVSTEVEILVTKVEREVVDNSPLERALRRIYADNGWGAPPS